MAVEGLGVNGIVWSMAHTNSGVARWRQTAAKTMDGAQDVELEMFGCPLMGSWR